MPCICNDAIIDINNYKMKFYGCKYNHEANRIYDDFDISQKIDRAKIICSDANCKKNQRDDPSDFYKCLRCTKLTGHTKYYCNDCSKKHEKDGHIIIKYDEKNYYCEKHFNQFIKYCEKCEKDLCKDCEKEHIDHTINNYESIITDLTNTKNDLNKIQKYINDLRHIIEDIKHNLNGAMKIYDNYYYISQCIIEKYELYNQQKKNYRVIESINNLNNSNKTIIKDLEQIIDANSLKERVITLFDIYLEDRNNYVKGIQNEIKNKQDNNEDKKESNKDKKDLEQNMINGKNLNNKTCENQREKGKSKKSHTINNQKSKISVKK